MGVRCTLLGHKYGDAEIEREREERGEEAVVTIREVETCTRCGDRSVVSENKEVTAAGADPVTTPDEADAAPTSEPRPTESDAGDPVAEGTLGDAADAADAEEDHASVEADPEGAAGDGPAEEGPEHDPETDDGVILDDEPAEEAPGEREYGEWPDAEEDHASAEADPAAADAEGEPAPWPDADEDADEGYDAAPPDDEAADVDYPEGTGADGAETEAAAARDEAPTGPEQPTGPEGSTDPGEAADPDEPVTDDDAELLDDEGQAADGSPADEGADFERARAASSPSAPSTAGTELFCPACGYRDPSHDGSLREGDICPECRKGYLAAGE